MLRGSHPRQTQYSHHRPKQKKHQNNRQGARPRFRHLLGKPSQLAGRCPTAKVDELLYKSALEVCVPERAEDRTKRRDRPGWGAKQKVDEIKVALRELGLPDDVLLD